MKISQNLAPHAQHQFHNIFFNKACDIRIKILDMLTSANSSHLGPCFSIVDIITVLYHHVFDIKKIASQDRSRDFFILSKGHAAAALYAVLHSVDLIPDVACDNYACDGSTLAGHPIKGAYPGIEASTGSLGHGLSLGVGLALAHRHDGLSNRVYVLMGDGECQEGSVWEALMMASRFALNNLTIIIDYNKLQGYDRTDDIVRGSFEKRFQAFGAHVMTIDGHDFTSICDAFSGVGKTQGPDVIIANTIKGKGISCIEDKLEWHYKSFKNDEYLAARKALNALKGTSCEM